MTFRTFPCLLVLLAAGCAPSASESTDGTAAADTTSSPAKIEFTADWRVVPSAPLLSGRKVEIDYDAARVTSCTGDLNGKPGWSTTGFWRVNGGAVGSFWAAGASPTGSTAPAVLDLPPEAGDADLEVWFQTTSVWGCVAWDSNFGGNYHLTLGAPPEAPGWIGNVDSITARGTCSGKPCEQDRHALGASGVTFDTWVRQRAEFAEISFEVYEQGVTDWNDPDTWKKLDVEAHVRFGGVGDFAKSYVSIEDHVGNNVRYGDGLRPIDPFGGPAAPQSKADCPAAPIHLVNGSLEADAEIYFTVNGIDVRPSPGAAWPVKFLENPGPYSICVTP